MDVKRDPAILRRKRIRNGILWGVAGIGVVVLSVALSKLKPAAQSVPHNTLWYDTVKRGSMVREVRGAGSLVPEEIRWITATTSGKVERIVLRAGAQVKPGTVILELSNIDLQQQANNAEMQWKSALAQLENAKANLRKERAQLEAGVSNATSNYNVAKTELEANKTLQTQGLASDLQVQRLQANVNQAQNTMVLAENSLKIAKETEGTQLATQEAAVSQAKANADTFKRQLEDLKVKSTMTGVLQLVQAEEGATIGPGQNIIRVSDPTNLKAQIRISETQMRDLRIGQKAEIDTRNGLPNAKVPGHVSRIDPAAANGTVGVDVTLDGPLPPGARPDLSIDGVVELERLENVLYVQHPTFGQENSTVSLFKVTPNNGETTVGAGQEPGHEAISVPVKFGRQSVSFIEVVDGLREGDHIILSDMTQYDGQGRIKIVG